MDIKKLNEEISIVLNEISDQLKQSYIAGREKQLADAQAKLAKARGQVKKSDIRQINTMPTGVDLETAKNALNDLKYEMKKVSSGSEWRGPNEEDGTIPELVLEVRHWGNWQGDDGSGDYDWQELDAESQEKLDEITRKICKKYSVNINVQPTEKNWIVATIEITKKNKDSVRSYSEDKVWDEFIKRNHALNITTTMHRNKGQSVLQFEAYGQSGTRDLKIYKIRLSKVEEGKYTIDYKTLSRMSVWKPLIKDVADLKTCLEAAQNFIDKRKASKENPNRKRSVEELFKDFMSNPSNIWSCIHEVMKYCQGSFNGYYKDFIIVKFRYGVPWAEPSAVTIYTDGKYKLYHKFEKGLGELSEIKFIPPDVIETGRIEKEEFNDMHALLVKLIRRCREKAQELRETNN